jgi:hypothetical protein
MTLITAPWAELGDLDTETPIWQVPAARMKLRLQYNDDDERGHLVPLSTQAIDVIQALRRLTGRTPYLFPNPETRPPLPDAPRGLGCRTVLDLAQHRYDVGCGDILDRGGAEVGKDVPFQRMENVIGMLFDPMPFVHVVPIACDYLERGSSVGDDLQTPEPLLDSGVWDGVLAERESAKK